MSLPTAWSVTTSNPRFVFGSYSGASALTQDTWNFDGRPIRIYQARVVVVRGATYSATTPASMMILAQLPNSPAGKRIYFAYIIRDGVNGSGTPQYGSGDTDHDDFRAGSQPVDLPSGSTVSVIYSGPDARTSGVFSMMFDYLDELAAAQSARK